ncbi:LTA synthase family protein [Lentibacillus saliphilus]|uniref:LTA synthase family protein n=1 Tax=Lentibacillus saliphilus TaxID=2737028 RepID=UPI001C304E9A|nr:LTA synthase family protein [Lentibacillus saliphilus]
MHLHKYKAHTLPVYVMAVLLFGTKTYVMYRFVFSIHMDNVLQEFILFINPFVSAFLLFGLSVWIKNPSKKQAYIRYTALIGSFIIYGNLVFYRSFTDFLTIPQLFQMSNANDLGGSVLSLVKVYDVLFFIDVVLIWRLCSRQVSTFLTPYQRGRKMFVLSVSLMLLSLNFLLAEMERPQLFTRAFDRAYLVKNIGLFNYHIYDLVVQSKTKTQRVFADGNELPEIKTYMDQHIHLDQPSELTGIAKGKNIIFIWAESLQSFVINNDVKGQEVTPFLNELTRDEDTFYFENFYHQTEQGKTSDSEFLVANSLYPLSSGAVFFTHAQNDFYAIPEQIKDIDYTSAVFHANNKSFWNRDQMYERLGYDHFYDQEAFAINEADKIGWGLNDESFFKQSIPYLDELEKPFYAKFITLTNHFPFELDEEDRSIEPYDSKSSTLNNYFPTVRYMDEAIETFFNELQSAGLYEDSIILIMGDHYGISANHHKAMGQYLNQETLTPYDHIQLQRVPFFIHIPGYGKGEIVEDIAGQIDVKPTLLHLLDINTTDDMYFGNDLFQKEHKGFIALRNGDFVSEDYVYASQSCYKRQTGELLTKDGTTPFTEDEAVDPCADLYDQVKRELNYSDQIIYGDLFRFHDFGTQR